MRGELDREWRSVDGLAPRVQNVNDGSFMN